MSERRALGSAELVLHPESIRFVDRHHVGWRVTERDARRDPGSRGDRCLVFECETAIRRVWVYPPAWRTLSAPELEALSWAPLGMQRVAGDRS